MIENEADLGALAHQRDRILELPVLDADVEAQIEARQELHRLDEARLEAEAGLRLDLDQAANAAGDAVGGELFEIRRDRGAVLERGGGDHALDPPVPRREPIDERRFLEVLAGIRPDLDEHDPLDLDRPALAIELGQQPSLIERRLALDPAVADDAGIVEVDVAVDDRKVGHGSSPVHSAGRAVARSGGRARVGAAAASMPRSRRRCAATARPTAMISIRPLNTGSTKKGAPS